jgi:very-short-patch-repair endonuclease
MSDERHVRNSSALVPRARALRARLTPSEARLWRALRGRRFVGANFRRQHPFDQFVLDFYCARARLGLEIDGGHHFSVENKQGDAERSGHLAEDNIEILRFTNSEVMSELEAVLSRIQTALEARSPKT